MGRNLSYSHLEMHTPQREYEHLFSGAGFETFSDSLGTCLSARVRVQGATRGADRFLDAVVTTNHGTHAILSLSGFFPRQYGNSVFHIEQLTPFEPDLEGLSRLAYAGVEKKLIDLGANWAVTVLDGSDPLKDAVSAGFLVSHGFYQNDETSGGLLVYDRLLAPAVSLPASPSQPANDELLESIRMVPRARVRPNRSRRKR